MEQTLVRPNLLMSDQGKPKLWSTEVTRFKYALDLLSYEITDPDNPKIQELAQNLYRTLFMALSRPMPERDARLIREKLLNPVKELRTPITRLTHSRINSEAKRIALSRLLRQIGNAVTEFEVVQPSKTMSSEDIQRLFDILSMRLHDRVERKQDCDAISDFTINFYSRLSEKYKTNQEIEKHLFKLYNNVVNELRQVAIDEKLESQLKHLKQARDSFSKLTTIEMLEKAQFVPSIQEEIVKGFMDEAQHKMTKTGVGSPRDIQELTKKAAERRKKHLEVFNKQEEVRVGDLLALYPDLQKNTLSEDLARMAKKDKTIRKVGHGLYAITRKGKEKAGGPKSTGEDEE